jgi:hypothetical protein
MTVASRLVLVTVLTLSWSGALAQDSVDRIRQLYVAADYDGALAELDRLPPATLAAEQLERDRYRAMALIALGRTPEAHAAIERILLADPTYEPGEEEAAPRIRIAFSDVRRRVLPQMARSLYAEGKGAFDRRDLAKALPAFERALIVIDLLPAGEPGMADLRTLASGFLQLTRASATATEPVPTGSTGSGSMPATVATGGSKAPPATITAPDPGVSSPEASPATPHPPETSSTTAGDSPSATPGEAGASASSASPPIAPVAGVTMTEPVPLRQDLPPWRPTKNELREFSGIIELDIDEHGDVVAARMINAVHPVYDLELLTATRLWKYEPARRNGVAVKSSKRISVVLHPY